MSTCEQRELEMLKLQMDAWKEAISTLKHFSEASIKTRHLGFTFVVAVFALAIALLTQFPDARVLIALSEVKYGLHISGPLVIFSAIGMYATKILDMSLYHRMFRASLAFAEDLEANTLLPIPKGTNRGLAQSMLFFGRSKKVQLIEAGDVPAIKTSEEEKIRRFYNISISFVLVIGICLTYITST